MFLSCSGNNKATAVLDEFQKAVGEHGLPSCVRADQGTENFRVATYMLNHPSRVQYLEGGTLLQGQAYITNGLRDCGGMCLLDASTLYYYVFYYMEEAE